MKVRIAGVQMAPEIAQKRANLDKCLDRLHEAAAAGARLVVFPECCLTGYCFSSREEARPMAETIPGPATEGAAEACRKLRVYAVLGLIERDGGRLYNAAVLLGPEGVIASYRKVHLPYLGVDRFLNKGNLPFAVHHTRAGNLGLNICYDASFPESARVMALAGADIIILPTNWPEGRQRVPNFVINTRAFENKVHYVAVDRVGRERGTGFIGRSKIVDAGGDTLAEAGPVNEEIIYADVDLTRARTKRTVVIPGQFEFDLLRDRRPDFYRPLTTPRLLR
ncbi:MAG: carbon-nitrogen hydrolase family protein [Chloroflexi bacterium]|nr:carbon-nitrogen hydrolase family protein [Chloroflexota bacterium]